ncbi:MAG: molybdopterin cofactor-binding domain-containing protein [Sporichthyaceae bacterium]
MTTTPSLDPQTADSEVSGVSRRRFVGFVLAGSTLAVGARYAPEPGTVYAAEGVSPVPSNELFGDQYDFMDFMRDYTRPTLPLMRMEMTAAGKVRYEVPRSNMGQRLETAIATIIADQMEIPVEDVETYLADARPELGGSQLTGGSASVYALWEPVRILAETMRRRLASTAAKQWGVSPEQVRTRNGHVFGPDGQMLSYAALAVPAAKSAGDIGELPDDDLVDFTVGPPKGGVIGTSPIPSDMRAAVTGAKKFAMDLDIPNALPTMVCRPPTINGSVVSVRNLEAVKKMPGVTDVGVIPINTPNLSTAANASGVAVRAKTFGQCIDAVRALKVEWSASSNAGKNSDDYVEQVNSLLLGMLPPLPGGTVIEETTTHQFRSSSPLETNCAIADVREDQATLYLATKIPNTWVERIAVELLGMPLDKVSLRMTNGGGSFGRKLFADAAWEAAAASQLFGKPVRLMYHRTDDNRHGRMHPAAVNHTRATVVDRSVTSFTQRHATWATDFSHGAGEIVSSYLVGGAPDGRTGNRYTTSPYFYQAVVQVPYNFGLTDVLADEVGELDELPTSAVRNVSSPENAVGRETVVESLAEHFGMDGYEFRRAFLKKPEAIAVLDAVAKAGKWGRKMKPGTAQAIAFHEEYKCSIACMMEIDARPRTVNRRIQSAATGMRITKAIIGVDIGLPINPDGVKAQLMGGCMDGIAYALTQSSHIEDGLPLEGSWDNCAYTRQWNTPFEFQAIVMPARRDWPGGAGEIGIAAAYACAANAVRAVTGKTPTEFPTNYRDPLHFAPKPKVPSIPQSPTNGLRFAR